MRDISRLRAPRRLRRPSPRAPPPTHPRVYQLTAHALSLHREHAPGYRPRIPWKFRNRPRIARLTAFLLLLRRFFSSKMELRSLRFK